MRITLLMLLIIPAVAQAAWGGRLELEGDKKLSKKLGLKSGIKLDFDDDLRRLEAIKPEAELTKKFNKHLRLSAGYRAIFFRRRDAFSPGHRLYFELGLGRRLAALQVKFRTKLQGQWKRKSSWQFSPVLRNRVGASLRLVRRVQLKASAEHFLALDAVATAPTRLWRATVGPDFGLGFASVAPFVRGEWSDGELQPIIGLGLSRSW